MTSITAGFDALLENIASTDRRIARRTGEHIDRMKTGLSDLEEAGQQYALLPAKEKDFKCMRDLELKSLLTAYGVKGRGRKGLKKADRISLLVQHKVPALTFEFLLDFYLTTSR